MKGIFVVSIILLVAFNLNACGESVKSKINTNKDKAVPVCLSTQSKCRITTEVGEFEVLFSQEQSQLSLRADEKPLNQTAEQNLHQIITELSFTISLQQINSNERTQEVKNVTAYLEGKDMFMGKIPVFFNKQVDENQKVKFTANSLLASCSEDVMVWRLWLTVQLVNSIKDEVSSAQIKEQVFFIDFESLRL